MRGGMVAVLTAMLAAMAVALPLAAQAEVIHVDGVFAAGAREASLLPTIGVDLFNGPNGDALGTAIERRLAALGRDGVPHARIVAPSLRPDGLLTGRATSSVDDYAYEEARDRCIERKDDKCTRRVTYRVPCIRRTVTLYTDLRLTRYRDGRILYSQSPTRSDTNSWCRDSGAAVDPEGTVQFMVESIAEQVRLDLAPHHEAYKIRIREDRDGLPPDLAAQFKQGVHQTKHDERTACATFAAIGVSAPDHGPTLFNRALCAEAAGRYDEATALYTRARVFAPKAAGDVTKGMGRVASLAAGAEDVRHMAAL